MEPIKLRKRPEHDIQQAIIKMLRYKLWFVMSTHGNLYQAGFPDLYCTHAKYGIRWVEVKNPSSYKFTTAQLRVFPQLSVNGTGIWILTAATELEYNKLFKQPNWSLFL